MGGALQKDPGVQFLCRFINPAAVRGKKLPHGTYSPFVAHSSTLVFFSSIFRVLQGARYRTPFRAKRMLRFLRNPEAVKKMDAEYGDGI